jgi:predicted enzyme related to lactoylglutathione lyase
MAVSHPNGLFSWTDIGLPDPAAGRDFYTALFGWDAEDQFDPDGNYIYTMFSKGGKSVAGLGGLPPGGDGGEGPPPMWQSYVTVDDVDATIAAATRHGGSVIMPAMDVMTSGRMAILADPTGGVFSLWQAGDHPGGELFNEHGALTWNELATRDTQAARDFYGAVFPWSFERFEESPAEYWVIHLAGKPGDDPSNGGIMAMDENWPAEISPHWMVYFHVADVEATVAKLEELGGSVSVPPFDTAAGKIAVVGDPQGGTFSIITPPAS